MRNSPLAVAVVALPETDATFRPEGCWTWFVGDLPVVSLPAVVDCANAHLLRSALQKACTAGSIVVVDMTSTTFLDAAGVGAVAPIGTWLRETGGELRLVVRCNLVQRLLETLSVHRMFRTYTNLVDALASDRPDPLPYASAA